MQLQVRAPVLPSAMSSGRMEQACTEPVEVSMAQEPPIVNPIPLVLAKAVICPLLSVVWPIEYPASSVEYRAPSIRLLEKSLIHRARLYVLTGQQRPKSSAAVK